MNERLQWARVFKIIREHESIAINDLAEEELKVDRDSPELRAAIEQLKKQGRVRVLIGTSKKGAVCDVIEPVKERLTRRQLASKEEKTGE